MKILSFLFAGFVTLASLAAGLYLLFVIYKEKGIGHALLGFFIPIYAYGWGWLNGKRLQILDIMGFWTVMIIFSVVSPLVIAGVLVDDVLISNNESFPISGEFSSQPMQALGSEDAIAMGSMAVGERVEARIDDIFEVHDWTFVGTAGQTVTIQGNALPGDSTDPRVNLLGPDGTLLTGADDSAATTNAYISAYTLPQDGTYTLQVDVWQTGGYELILD